MALRPIATLAVADAIANVGVHEVGGENHGKYVETYLASVGAKAGAPWCMAFAYYRLSSAAANLGTSLPDGFPKTAYTPTAANWFKSHGKWISVSEARKNPSLITPGDLVFFYFASKGRIAHVGIVVSVDANGVHTIEGNTSNGTSVTRDGDGVYARYRTWFAIGSLGGFGQCQF